MHCVILCGGSGNRLWPLSRKNFPKQFLSLFNGRSLLQETFLRIRKIIPEQNIYFITNNENFFNVFNQIKDISSVFSQSQILIEPASLDTAPAIIFSIKYLGEKLNINKNEPVIFLPCDHYIKNEEKFCEVIKTALSEVKDRIGTIGITPIKPETEYGYIKKGDKRNNFYDVIEFKEKPDMIQAQNFIKSGQYVWNSGTYISNIKTLTDELQLHSPELYSFLNLDFDNFLKKFNKLPSVSIEKAICEKSDKIIVFQGDFDWADVKSFDSLENISENKSRARQMSVDSNNIFIHSAADRLIATVGVKDLIIIDNYDSILIQKKGESQALIKIIDQLKESKMEEIDNNLLVYRPWGKYEVLINEKNHKVKKMTVYPGSKLSLQAHRRRAEHWVVVKGTAKIINGDKILVLKENESTFIPALARHRLENIGKIDLEIIEVQTGGYLEEDDIIRYDDEYKRS